MPKPNLEVVRRICLMHGCKVCWMRTNLESEKITLFLDVADHNFQQLASELTDWTGYIFDVQNNLRLDIESIGENAIEQILPIETQAALKAIRDRRRKNK